MLAVSLITLVVGILTKRFAPKLPYMIVAMVAGSLFALGLNAYYGVDTTHVRTVGRAALRPAAAVTAGFLLPRPVADDCFRR